MPGLPRKWYADDTPAVILYNFCRELQVDTCLDEMMAIMGRVIPDRNLIVDLYRRFLEGEYDIHADDRISININSIREINILLSMDTRLDCALAKHLRIVKGMNEFNEIILLLNRRTMGHVHIPMERLLRVLPARKDWATQMSQRLKKNNNVIVADAFWIYHPQIEIQDDLPPDISSVQRYHIMPKTLAVVFCSRDLNFKLLVRIFSLNRKNTLKWYLRRPLRMVFKRIRAHCRGVPLLYHHDLMGMGSLHRIRVTDLGQYYGIPIIIPPPCSPDLAFSYHGLYAQLKNLVTPPVLEFDNMMDVAGTEIIENWDDIPNDVWSSWFRSWLSYLISCTFSNGRYMTP